MYHSESGQDRWLDENVFKGRMNGVFAEAGAMDGVTHSNSLFFERQRDWTGLLIEPNPLMSDIPSHNRTSATTTVAFTALSDKTETLQFEAIGGPLHGWSGIPMRQSDYDRRRIADNVPLRYRRLFPIEAHPLALLMRGVGITKVDYLSLDVEGGELAILSAFPFDEIPIEVIGVEDNSGSNTSLADLLRSKGYEHLTRLGADEIWRKQCPTA